MEPAKAVPIKSSQITKLAKKLEIPVEQVRAVIDAMNEEGMGQRTASVQFLYLMANALSRLCTQEMQLRQRIQELTALFNISTMLSGTRGLQQILDRITRAVAEALHVKSCSLRLMEEHRDELVIKSVYGLSDKYLKKGPVTIGASTIDRAALSGQTVYIGDMGTDERVIYPEEAKQEPEMKAIAELACERAYNIVHLIYQSKAYEGHSKDYEFGPDAMREHWQSGLDDIRRTLADPHRLDRPPVEDGVVTHDVHRQDR